MSNFTPGKWGVHPAGGIYADQEPAPGESLARRVEVWLDEYTEEHKANARLVAAAPELFEAVFELLYYAREVCDNNGGESETRGRAPRIWKEIQEYETLLQMVRGKEEAQ